MTEVKNDPDAGPRGKVDDRRAQARTAYEAGMQRFQSGLFADAIHLFQIAEITAGDRTLRFKAQKKIADSLLSAREFESAAANYRQAEALAPQSADRWLVRSHRVLALARARKYDEAKALHEEVEAYAAQADVRSDGLERMLEQCRDGLDLARGDYLGPAHRAKERAVRYEREEQEQGAALSRRVASAYTQAAAAFALAAETTGTDWASQFDEAMTAIQRARDAYALLGRESSTDQAAAEATLGLCFLNLIGAKHSEDEEVMRSLLAKAQSILDEFESDVEDEQLAWHIRFQKLVLRHRIAERADPDTLPTIRAELRKLGEANGTSLQLWLQVDLVARWGWTKEFRPLEEDDNSVFELLRMEEASLAERVVQVLGRGLAVGLLVLGLSIPAFAGTWEVSGTVIYSDGVPAPGALVTLTSAAGTGAYTFAATDGSYAISLTDPSTDDAAALRATLDGCASDFMSVDEVTDFSSGEVTLVLGCSSAGN